MKTTPRRWWRILTAAAGMATMIVAWACIQRPMKVAQPTPERIHYKVVPASSERDVDMLFVIDNSNSMADEQTNLGNNFPILMQVLQHMAGGLPNVHIGVTTTDVGTFPYTGIQYCEEGKGDDGNLLTGGCGGINGAYLVDVEPKGCNVERDPQTGQCSSHNCSNSNCAQSALGMQEPDGLQMVEDEFGCPRCRNYGNQKLSDAFNCVATSVGITGCGFEQPLEAMKRSIQHAAEPAHQNHGFLRNNAYLSIFFISDEDDCSAADPEVFNDNPRDQIDSQFGPLTSYRCYEFGVKCDEPWDRTTPEKDYHNCRPIEETDTNHLYIQAVAYYEKFLRQAKDPDMLIVSAIAGPFNGGIHQTRDDHQFPAVREVCKAPGADRGADPAVRLKTFIESFNEEEDMNWAFTSVCAADYSPALEGLGNKLKTLLDPCVSLPIQGCPDPNHVLDTSSCSTPEAQGALTSECQPQCNVIERIKDEEGTVVQQSNIPYCGDVNGVDISSLNGSKIDPSLPVDVCWYVKYSDYCDRSEQLCLEVNQNGDCMKYITVQHYPSRGAEINIVRQQDAPPRTSYSVSCSGYAPYEQLCNDGIDDDGDCLIDADDPDCQMQ